MDTQHDLKCLTVSVAPKRRSQVELKLVAAHRGEETQAYVGAVSSCTIHYPVT